MRVVAGADAKVVVPRDGKTPPRNRAEDGLNHRERQNISVARKQNSKRPRCSFGDALRCAQQLFGERKSRSGIYAWRIRERVAGNIRKTASRECSRQVIQNLLRGGSQQFADGFKQNSIFVIAPGISAQLLKQLPAHRDVFAARAQELQQLFFAVSAGNGSAFRLHQSSTRLRNSLLATQGVSFLPPSLVL